MKSKKIIVASSHVLDGPLKLGSSHIARTWAAGGHDTLYLNAPTSPFHLLHPRSRAAARRRSAALRPRLTEVEGLIELSPLTLVPHFEASLLRSPRTLRNWPRLTYPCIERLIDEAGFGNSDTILFDSVMFWPFVKKLQRRSVYRVADRIECFTQSTDAMIALHREAVREADFVLYTADDLAPSPDERRKPSRLIPNGVQYDLFQAPQQRPPEYAGIKGPIGVYVGALEAWFDVDALHRAALQLPHMSFILIGPGGGCADLTSLLALPNVRHMGPRLHAQLPAYLQHADVGLIPFDIMRHGALLDAVCPLKLFEYLASGLPVVCYGGREVRRLAAPIALYDPRTDGVPEHTTPVHSTLVSALSETITTAREPTERDEERRRFARRADWRQRVADLEAALAEAGLW